MLIHLDYLAAAIAVATCFAAYRVLFCRAAAVVPIKVRSRD